MQLALTRNNEDIAYHRTIRAEENRYSLVLDCS